ncbi:hypothetical protein BRARA_G00106 [Brassica rapa]|uniref:GRF-type domain-containing protein n=1 Tax=Brassica campestris TaxID=3711 RepID=A0A397YGQ7_BRACM|nr:hypothetical protein BRARA_G00106 [Brassica rapa]
MSDSSSSATSGGIRVRTLGIPIKCWCGEQHMTELISKFNQNPYRMYYRCCYAAQRKLENDNHIFKWFDEAFTDEIRQLDYQVRMLEEEEVQVLKATIRSEGLSKWGYVLKNTPIISTIYDVYSVVRIRTYGIVYVLVSDVRDFIDALEVKVKPIVQRIDDVDLHIARRS